MSSQRMADREPGLKQQDYSKAFEEALHDEGYLDVGTVLHYMDTDPANEGYLRTMLVQNSRNVLEATLAAKFPAFKRPNVMFYSAVSRLPTYHARSTLLAYFDQLASGNLLQFADLGHCEWAFALCIFCGEHHSQPVLTAVGPGYTHPGLIVHSMFDTDHPGTRAALSQWTTAGHGYLANRLQILCVCKRCYLPCTFCGSVMPVPHVTYDMLVSYGTEQTCTNCGADNIVRLPCPKPSGKELRVYRVKIQSLGKVS